MRLDEVMNVGEVFEIQLPDCSVHTKLQEFLGDNRFEVFAPTIKGMPIRSDRDGVFSFLFHRENGIYTFDAQMEETFKKDELMLCRFRQVSNVEKHQRRQAFRLPISLNVVLELMIDDETALGHGVQFKAKTVDISEKSILITCFSSFLENTKVTATIKFTEEDIITFPAKVLRCKKSLMNNNIKEIALLFINLTEKDTAFIRKYIFKKQIVAHKKRGLYNSSKGSGDV